MPVVMVNELTRNEYRLLIEHSPVLVWRAARTAKCDYFNDTWLAFTGRTFEQEFGDGWTEGVHPDDLERSVQYYLEHFARRQAFEMEYRLRRHDGIYRWILDRGAPYYDDHGSFAGFLGSCVDIDDRRRAQAERDEQLAEAHAFDEWILAIVSHDIRNPLGAIALAARVLEQTDNLAMVQRSAARILRGADRIQHIVADLLDLSRERRGGYLPLRCRETDLVAVCGEVVEELAGTAPDRAFDLHCAGDAHGRWDVHRLTQAVSNLVANAIQHSAAGTPITIAIEERGAEIYVAVHNDGQIAPTLLPALFDAFQLGGERRKRGQGLGLGLFITKAIAHAHCGSIHVTSTENGGTTFCMVLPRDRPEPCVRAPTSAREP
jgi:two-component system CheB/CheR fusion protein